MTDQEILDLWEDLMNDIDLESMWRAAIIEDEIYGEAFIPMSWEKQ